VSSGPVEVACQTEAIIEAGGQAVDGAVICSDQFGGVGFGLRGQASTWSAALHYGAFAAACSGTETGQWRYSGAPVAGAAQHLGGSRWSSSSAWRPRPSGASAYISQFWGRCAR
jgi:hypothetical protein